jgi:acetyltransferase-like isoleucine patch superfamily enzyme
MRKGESSFIGIGTTIIQGIKIGKNVNIGAGSVVIKDIPDNVIAVGNSAKIIKSKNKIW